jgi:LysM repeat protein
MEDIVEVAEDDPAPPASGEERKSEGLFSPNDSYTYTVVAGDTVMQIAKDFVVDPQQLRKMNDLSAGDEVKPGQQILIPPANL